MSSILIPGTYGSLAELVESTCLENKKSVKRFTGSNPVTSSMSTFELKDGQIVCKKCGSKNVSIKAGMMVDRAWCNDCNNEDYL